MRARPRSVFVEPLGQLSGFSNAFSITRAAGRATERFSKRFRATEYATQAQPKRVLDRAGRKFYLTYLRKDQFFLTFRSVALIPGEWDTDACTLSAEWIQNKHFW